jgi:light-regulated signal transduction histidine kinase (bacteriophytochrome)
MLEGFDPDWNYVHNKRLATYTNIDPGEYVFRVKGSNNDGVWNNEGRSIKIIITPPFWQTSWFLLLNVVLLINILILFYKIRTARIRQYNRELEMRVIERTKQYEETTQELEAFSYSISHDLHAPLRRIKGFSQALLEDYSNRMDKKAIDYIHRIQRGSHQMNLLIDDLLKLSRLSRSELVIKKVNLSAMVKTIAEEYKKMDSKRTVEFIIDKNRYVNGDESLFKVMIRNLIDNAWKFTSPKPVSKIEFGTIMSKNETIYYIKDNGIGFEPSYAEKIFEVFFRLNNKFEGTGIGLATVKRIIKRHQGRIWAEGLINKGATFYFTL